MSATAKCDKCDDNLHANSKSITCSSCDCSFHNMCVKLKDTVSKAVSDNNNILWFCDVCVQTVKANFKTKPGNGNSRLQALEVEVSYLKKLLNEVEDKNSLLKSDNDLLHKRITSLEDEITLKVTNATKSSNSEDATSLQNLGAIGSIEQFF